jgi:acyl-coenzyme A synthetase/AMP-(fatty) acid ligase/thioesterase domain-containing protein/acyl carrier protein
MLSSSRRLDPAHPADVPDISLSTDGRSLVARWRAVVAAHPTAVAAMDAMPGGGSFTFAELDRLSDLVALELVRVAGGADRPIAAVLGHDARAVVALIALIKTGRIRVVLDTHLPTARLARIAELSTATAAVVDDRHRDLADGIPQLTQVVSLDELLDAATTSPLSDDELRARVTEELALGASRGGIDPFEIVFTSGSTGVPKGVLQRHGSFLNELFGYSTIRGYRPGDRAAAVLPLSFLAGSVSLVATLLSGATAVLLDPRDTGIPALASLLRTGGISVLVCTPHLIRGVVEALDDAEVLADLRVVVTLGEGIHGRDVRAILAHLPADGRYVNEVGSSEIDAIATFTVRPGDPVPDGSMPAGSPFPNKRVRILDEAGDEVPAGVAGDVVVSSDFLSGGYWNDDEQNSAKFGRDDSGREFVRQGDLGRIDESGILHLLGRGDSAVKIRGYLVEPSEVEGALLGMDDVAEAVVVPVVSQESPPLPTRLVAYVAPTAGVRPPSSAALRRSLRQVVPEYMVPAEIVHLAALPRTERGKIDRMALPVPPPRDVDQDAMDDRQVAMAALWQSVLELPIVGLDDDFMALGGDSLSAEELLALVKQTFGVALASTEILAFPTLAEFTERVTTDSASLPPHPDVVPLNPTASGNPYFVIAGAGALALTFQPLSLRFPESPMYAFQQHGLEERVLPDWSVEASATRHLQVMRLVRPYGPYRLMGHSFGGLIALEMARQLVAAGEEVESLAILDAYLPQHAPRGGDDDAAPATAVSLRQRFLPDGLPRPEGLRRQFRAYLAGIHRPAGQAQYQALYDQANLVTRRYSVKPYTGRTVLVQADDNPDGPSAWDAILIGERHDVVIAAEHTAILREPHVTTLAAALRPLLAPYLV